MILREDEERSCPPVIRDVLVGKDGWSLYDESKKPEEQPPFNLFWKTNRFYPSQIQACQYPFQRCNHYPKSAEITKKDGLYRHMKRMRVTHGPSLFSFFPDTFTLPNEYVKFCQFFADERDKAMTTASPSSTTAAAVSSASENPGSSGPPKLPMYICKPSDLSRGRKIFVFDDIGDLTYDCSSVVQKYVDRPLLIVGHKVDFRVYVLVTSFQPLRIYMYDDFLTRFGGEKYTTDSKDTYVHLTNYSVTKTSTSDALIRAGVGETCKWDGTRTREYFKSCGVDFSLMWSKIETLVRCTLLSIFHLVPTKPQCFELYGFDILFDEQFNPWLIEANFSPALAVESSVDVRVKHALIHDLIMTLNIQKQTDKAVVEEDQDRRRGDSSRESVPREATKAVNRPSQLSSSRIPAPKKGTGVPPSEPTTTALVSKRSNSCSVVAPAGSSTARPPLTASSTTTTTTTRTAQTLERRTSSGLVKGRSSSSTSRNIVAESSSASSSPSSSTTLVDKPYGGMKLIFPFNDETEALSRQSMIAGSFDASLKGMLQEVRKKDGSLNQQLKTQAKIYEEAIRSSTKR